MMRELVGFRVSKNIDKLLGYGYMGYTGYALTNSPSLLTFQ